MTDVTARLEQFVESCMPSEAPIYRVTDIDFERWRDEGVRGVVFDVEDTFGPAGAQFLTLEYTWAAAKARQLGMHTAIGTNKVVKTRADELMLEGWGKQLDVDLVLPPLRPQDAKPSPINLHKARTAWHLEPEEMAMVDDKATAGVRAANFAGFEHNAWTRPIGGNRHIGDRLVRDPAEKALRLYAHLALNPRLSELPEAELKEILERKEAWHEFKDAVLLAPVEKGTASGTNKIVGYGLEDIQLDQATLDTIMRPAFRVVLEQLQTGALEGTEGIRKVIDDYLYENGRTLADFSTNIRPFLAGLEAVVALSDIDPRTKRRATHGLKIARDVADAVDGYFARKHKDGATADGGRRSRRM